MAKVKRYEEPVAERATGFDVQKKIEEIKSSRLPDCEKEAYIERLTVKTPDAAEADRVPFSVYARIRGLAKSRMAGMVVYPKAAAVKAATVKEWDEIFKDF